MRDLTASPLTAVVQRRLTLREVAAVGRIERERRILLKNRTSIRVRGEETPRTISEQVQRTAKPRRQAIELFKLIRHAKPRRCVELGTSIGISAAYQATALEMNSRGWLRTIEGSPDSAKAAGKLLDRLKLGHVASVLTGTFEDWLPSVLAEHSVDYAFIDGNHREEPTIGYFEMIEKRANPGAMIVFDDITWSDEMRSAWVRVQEHERVTDRLDLGSVGVLVL